MTNELGSARRPAYDTQAPAERRTVIPAPRDSAIFRGWGVRF